MGNINLFTNLIREVFRASSDISDGAFCENISQISAVKIS